MIEYETLLSLPFLKKSRFTGSERGMRYCVKMVDREGISMLEASVCPGPFSIDATRKELFCSMDFPFTNDGKKEAVDWLNQEYQRQYEFFEDVFRHPMRYYKKHHIAE